MGYQILSFLLDVAAGLLLLSATTGFCHVRKVLGRECSVKRD
jgi:hypothetical protein